MPFNGSGLFQRIYNWVVDRDASVKIRADRIDTEMDGFATGLSNCVTADGQTTATARVPFAQGIGLGDGSAGVPALGFIGDTDTGIRRTGANTMTLMAGGVDIMSVGPTGLTGLSASNATTARSALYAAPFDALAYNGMQLNGGFDISQEYLAAGAGLGSVTPTLHTYVVDSWQIGYQGTFVINAVQVTDAPPGHSYSLAITTATAQVSMGATDICVLLQTLEGTRVSRLAWGTANAQPLSFAFWVKVHRTGMYSGTVKNAANDVAYIFTFTVNVADTWEYKTVTIATGETAHTWPTGAVTSLYVGFAIAAGSGYQTTPNVWGAANDAATGTTNGVAAITDSFKITGLIMLPGIELPTAARSAFLQRPYEEELELAQRLLRVYRGSATGFPFFPAAYYSDADNIDFLISWLRPMRDVPSLQFQGTLNTHYGVLEATGMQGGFAFSRGFVTTTNMIVTGAKTAHGLTVSHKTGLGTTAATNGAIILNARV